jgi:hypothetical protein
LAPHQLRHAHAVEMSREGVPLVVIQRQLGHAELGVTSVYLRGIDNPEIVHAVHERQAPMIPAAQRASASALSQTSQGPRRLARPARAGAGRGLLDRVAGTLQARARRAAGSAQTRPRLSGKQLTPPAERLMLRRRAEPWCAPGGEIVRRHRSRSRPLLGRLPSSSPNSGQTGSSRLSAEPWECATPSCRGRAPIARRRRRSSPGQVGSACAGPRDRARGFRECRPAHDHAPAPRNLEVDEPALALSESSAESDVRRDQRATIGLSDVPITDSDQTTETSTSCFSDR